MLLILLMIKIVSLGFILSMILDLYPLDRGMCFNVKLSKNEI